MFFHCYFSVFSREAVCLAKGFSLCSFPCCCSCSLDDYWKRQSLFFHLRVQDSNNLVPSGLITLFTVLASVSAGLFTFSFPEFPFMDKRRSTRKLRKIVEEAWPHRNAKPPFFNSIKEAIHSKSNNLAVNHSHFQTCFWLEKRERIKCLFRAVLMSSWGDGKAGTGDVRFQIESCSEIQVLLWGGGVKAALKFRHKFKFQIIVFWHDRFGYFSLSLL